MPDKISACMRDTGPGTSKLWVKLNGLFKKLKSLMHVLDAAFFGYIHRHQVIAIGILVVGPALCPKIAGV